MSRQTLLLQQACRRCKRWQGVSFITSQYHHSRSIPTQPTDKGGWKLGLGQWRYGRPLTHTRSFSTLEGIQAKSGRQVSDSMETPPSQESFTNTPVFSTTTPLGSLSTVDWDDAISSLMLEVQKAQDNPEGSIYWMTKADKLLYRLQAEFATKSFASRTRGDGLADCQIQVLQGWCLVGKQNPDNRLVTERAAKAFWTIVQRNKHDWWNKEQNTARRAGLVEAFLDLLETYARKERATKKDLKQVSKLLLWKDLPSIGLAPLELGPTYATLMQQIEVSGDKALLQQLELQWNRISDENVRQWFTEDSILEDISHSTDVDSKSQSDAIFHKSLSSFELERLISKTVSVLESTDPKDRERIDNLIGQWEKLISSGATQPSTIVNVILDYYTRSGDTANAIKWLAKVDLNNPADVPKEGLNRLLISLAEMDDPSAIWRAEEILRQVESSGGGRSLDSAVYTAIAERWLKSNESHAHRRIMELCFRPEKFDASLVSVLLRGLRREKDVSANMVDQLLEWFTSQNETLPSESRRELVEALLFVLQRHGKEGQGWELFLSEVEKGLEVDKKLCELVVASLPNSSNPDEVINIFQYLERKQVELDIGFFLESAKRLANLRGKERMRHLMLINDAVMKRLKSGAIDPQNPMVSVFFEFIFELLNYWKQSTAAMGLLGSMENSTLVNLPISCYSTTAATLSWKGKIEEIDSLYRKLQKLYEDGQRQLHPDNRFYMSYVRALSAESTANSSKIVSIFKRQLELLDELSEYYKSTQDTKYKPLAGIYKAIISTLTKLPATDENAAQAEALLNEMIAVEATDPKDPDPFTMTMHLILQSPQIREYESISKILKQMQEIGVTNSELVFVNALRACTRTQTKEQQEDAVKLTFHELGRFRSEFRGKSSSHGSRLYSLAFVSCLRNLPTGDKRLYPLMDQLVKCCCEDGYFTPQIKQQLYQSKKLSKDFLHSVYESKLFYGGSEPPEWSRNVSKGE